MRDLQKNSVSGAFEAHMAAGAETVSFISCSSSGIILYADTELSEIAGKDLVGRNIDSFLDPRVVSDIIAAYNDGQPYCELINVSGRKFELTSSGEGKCFNLTFKKADVVKEGIILNEKDFKGLSSDVRSALYAITGMFQDPELSENEKIVEAKKNFFNTFKRINGILDKIEYENELKTSYPNKYDLDELCSAIIVKIEEYGNGFTVPLKTDHGDHSCVVDKGQFDKALVTLFIYLYNAFGQKNSKISATIGNDGDKIFIRITAARSVDAGSRKKTGADIDFCFDEDNDILKSEELFIVKKFIEENKGGIVALNRNGTTSVTVSFVRAGSESDTPLRLRDVASGGYKQAIDSMLLFELGETLNGDN